MSTPVQQINTRSELVEFSKKYGLRRDWHEPDEQGIDARIIGTHLDNAMGSTMRPLPEDDPSNPNGELNVVLTYEEEDDAVVNLADLFAWAVRADQQEDASVTLPLAEVQKFFYSVPFGSLMKSTHVTDAESFIAALNELRRVLGVQGRTLAAQETELRKLKADIEGARRIFGL